jgi:hypothetical protein
VLALQQDIEGRFSALFDVESSAGGELGRLPGTQK